MFENLRRQGGGYSLLLSPLLFLLFCSYCSTVILYSIFLTFLR